MKKTLGNTDVNPAQTNVPDLALFGQGGDHDMSNPWKLLVKASSEAEGWMKSTKAMETPGGCLVQVTTQQRNGDGTYALAEALTFVPGVRVEEVLNDGDLWGRELVDINTP